MIEQAIENVSKRLNIQESLVQVVIEEFLGELQKYDFQDWCLDIIGKEKLSTYEDIVLIMEHIRWESSV